MTTADFTIGQTFNPYKRFNGVHIPEPICKHRGLSAGAKLVFGRLARFAGKDGKVYPSVARLGSELGISAQQARRYVRELEDGGFIRPSRTPGKSSQYEFLWHAAFEGELGKQRKTQRKQHRTTPKDGSTTTPVYGSTTTPEDDTPEDGSLRESVLLRESVEESPLRESVLSALVSSASLSLNETVSSSSVLNSSELVKGGAETDDSDDDEIPFSENGKPKTEDREALIDYARDALRASVASIRAKSEGITQTAALKTMKVPDKEIAVDILAAFQCSEDFDSWIADTESRNLANKARDPHAVYAFYRTDAKMRAEGIAEDRVKAERRAAYEAIEAERQRAAKAAEVKLLDTPMPALRAFGLVQPRLGGRGVPVPLKATLERTGALISPNALEHAIRGWKRCAQCDDGGTVGHAFHRTLAFCTCPAGIEASYERGGDWPAEEVARTHASVKNKLVAAARTISVYFADAIEASTIMETPSELVFDTPKAYYLYFKEKGFSEVFKVAGEQRAIRLAETAA